MISVRRFDWALFILVLFLVVFGLLIHYSLTVNQTVSGLNNFQKQLIFAGLGFFIFFILSIFDFRFLKPFSYFLYLLAILSLILTLFFGKIYHGVRGWLFIGPFNFQPVELTKLILIIVLANFWQKSSQPIKMSRVFLSLGLVLLPVLLIILQPDLGSALIILVIWFSFLLIVDKKFKHYLIIFILTIILSCLSWAFVLRGYQKDRILTYLNPERDPLGRGYQISQSIIAVGSGQLFGRGIGLGPQSQLKFLPAAETDFVYAALAEETGLIGSTILFLFFLYLFYHLARIAKNTYDNFGLFLVLGIILNLSIHFITNIGMNIGLLPIIGIPLPFISYGGSSLVTSLASLGLVESVVIHQPFTKKEEVL